MQGFSISLPALLMVLAFLSSCSRTVVYLQQEAGTGVYLTSNPIGNSAPFLEEMQQSVKRITSTSYYETYLFDPESQITKAHIDTAKSPSDYAAAVIKHHSTSSGTAVVVHNTEHRIGMITARHIISSPDTLYEFRDTGSSSLSSVSLKTNQINWLFDAPYVGPFEVLLSDEHADVAFIGARVDPDQLDVSVSRQFPVFPYLFGRPERLKTGTFIYSIGYPKGYPVVTTGIVSQSNRGSQHSFITDGLFNAGFSGGIVVAINGGLPGFEWVGMARSTSAEHYWHLVPDVDTMSGNQGHLPYRGELFVEQRTRINYGLTHVVSSDRIKRMLDENAVYLLSKGYNILPFIVD